MNRFYILLVAFASGALFSCKEAYHPDLRLPTKFYLVVEGVLNPGPGPTTISLTRTAPLDNTAIQPEPNAIVTIEGRDNTTRQLAYNGGSSYYSPGLNLIIGNEYRLRIRTNNGKEYLSQYVRAKITPAIDSIGWQRDQEGVRIYANAHDASDNTRYYRWDFDETWEIRSFYFAQYIYVNSSNTVRTRTAAEDVSRCWKFRSNTNIALASSERLQSDVIFKAPVNFIPDNDEKLSVRYSILLRQFALDKAGYTFYEQLKRNTESLGSIFDAQPSAIKSNIKCVTDSSEMVIGYLSASTIVEKRIFISNAELPGWRTPEYCPEEKVPNDPESIRNAFADGGHSPYAAVGTPVITTYYSSYAPCVDCTKRSGSTTRPSYW